MLRRDFLRLTAAAIGAAFTAATAVPKSRASVNTHCDHAAVSVPFKSLPVGRYIKGETYSVTIEGITNAPPQLPQEPQHPARRFSDPVSIGKSFVLEDTELYVPREAYMLEFFAYETTGGLGR